MQGPRRLSRGAQLQRGFTLVEILVVVAILGLLATLVVPNLVQGDAQARRDAARSDVGTLKGVIDQYLVQTQSAELPTWELLISPDARGARWLDGYSAIPVDPYGNPYELRSGPGGRLDFEVRCRGPDGLADTEDDITSRTLRDRKRG